MSSEYKRLCEAIADELFGSHHAGNPVYTLADTKVLSRIAAAAELTGDDPLGEIAEVVRSSLALDDAGVAPFRRQSDAAQLHKLQPLETPMALPLLLVLSIAAERMQADGDLAAHNYYSRLHQLLRVPTNRHQRVEGGYRQHAAELWGSLNEWLEAWEGERGIPTAYSVGGHEYVGLALSQAVVRQYDRDGLHSFFASEGLNPGTRLSPEDMWLAMDPYASATPSPISSHLRRLWKVPASRERIVDAACLELEAWDGIEQTETGAASTRAMARLVVFLRRFPRASIEFNLMLPYRSDGLDTAMFDVGDSNVTVPVSIGMGGSARLSGTESVSAASLVGELLSGSFGEGKHRAFVRLPKRVVPLRWDDMQGAYVETERVSLGEDGIVVAKADAGKRVEAHLETHARPGWSEVARLNGMPEGWLVYENVQILSAPVDRVVDDLQSLVPRARTSLTLRGGFALPGLLRKWSSLEPPEIVGLAAGASKVVVRVYRGTRIDDDALLLEIAQDDELNIVPLHDRALTDGEYLVAMLVDGASRPSSTALLRLRSAATSQFSVDDVDIRLVYSPEAASTWPLSAGPAKWGRFVNGARVTGLSGGNLAEGVTMPEFAPRVRPSSALAPKQVRIGVAMADDSCLISGSHRIRYPTVRPGQRATRSIVGECTTCGLVKRSAGTPWAARRRDSEAEGADRPVRIPPVAESSAPDFQVAFDALNHVGHGSYATFERITAQVEGSGLSADAFLRRQEALGHIDVSRDDWLQVKEWAVNSATLIPIAEDRWVLIGARSRELVSRLPKLVGDLAAVTESVDAELARIEVVGRIADQTSLIHAGIVVLEQASALTIAEALPALGHVAVGLKSLAVPRFRSAEFWDTGSASWRPTGSLGTPGAYRLKDFRSIYVIRSAEDIDAGHVRVANAQLAKHIANLWSGDPLVGYHSLSGSVVVPLGADLPGLYGRALSLCSGKAPREIVEHRMLQYPAVRHDVADVVFAKLTQ